MKWIGQHIYDFASTFRSDATFTSATSEKPIVAIQNTTNDTLASTLKFIKDKGSAGADGDHVGTIDFIGDDAAQTQTTFARIRAKVSEADNTDEAGQLILSVAESDGTTTALSPGLQLEGEHATDGQVDATIGNGSASTTTIAGTLTMGSTAALDNSGQVVVASQPNITTLAGLTSFGAAGATTDIAAGDITMYNAVNDGNPSISLGSSATERLEIKAEYESGAQGLDIVRFTTFTAGSGSDDGRYAFEVDDAFLLNILDGGLRIKASGFLEFGSGNEIISDSSGTTTLKNIDALDATTESTIESAIDTLSNLTAASSLVTVGTIGTGVWNGTAIAAGYVANGAIRVYGATTIKLLPSDFVTNEEGGVTKQGIGYMDHAGGSYGMKPNSANTDLVAFTDIPEGKKATHVDIYDKNDVAIEVFEVQVNATTMTSKGTGNCNTTLDITDVNASATNFLAIVVATTATSDRVFGGTVTIADQ